MIYCAQMFKNNSQNSRSRDWYAFLDRIKILKNLVRSGIRTHASNWRPEHSYALTAQARLESGALDRSAILTVTQILI